MTKVIVRKRAKHSKTRSGCRICRLRRIKCDEGRPACDNCRRGDRACLYDNVPVAQDVITRRRLEPAVRRYFLLPSTDLSSGENLSLEYFSTFTVPLLPQKLWWEHISLDLSRHDSTIAHAAAALGSMHRALASRDHAGALQIHGEQRSLANKQYTQAIAGLRHYIQECAVEKRILKESELVVVLLTCILFFCYEAFSGHDDKASLHLRTGLRILYEQTRSADAVPEPGDDRVITTTTTMRSYLDALKYTFVCLDNDLNMVDEEEPYLSAVCLEELPTSFHSLQQAHIHLDYLAQRANEVYRMLLTSCEQYLEQNPTMVTDIDEDAREFHIGCVSRLIPLHDNDPFWTEYESIRQDLKSWLSAFVSVPTTPGQRSDHLLSQIYFFYVWYRVETWRDATEELADRFEEQFLHITRLAEEYLSLHMGQTQYVANRDDGGRSESTVYSTPPLFSFGTGFVTTMMLVAIKCRISAVRRRCVAVIRSINLQGFFDSAYLASYLEAIMQLEEQQALKHHASGALGIPSELQAGDVPERARIFEPMMLPRRHVEQTNFYTLDHGEMMIAHFAEGSSNSLVVSSRPFARDPSQSAGTSKSL
ncbi:hypothetical protein DOTSEDRAFT_99043 [Lecanosticta acicola]|uniref:Zn(2)-C6 fungal-type domain-containing protein n=1 Tax=Lecanosticta acicola TaxID=111012 RepID=A0AAI9ECX4_9PEZI|nr:hypothetical protein DOTSEDRAFT_99043 [Lecanosticta acicola]